MVPRGEVGIVVANLGLAAGLLTTTTFSAVLVAVIGTTIVAPYLLAFAIPRATLEADAAEAGTAEATSG
jgi:Kef-type K+ transport system membrane component KefB